MKIVQTAGRDSLGEFAPKFAQLNDDVLFGEVWSRDELSLRDRSMITIAAFMGRGLVDSSFKYHLATAKKNGITKVPITLLLARRNLFISLSHITYIVCKLFDLVIVLFPYPSFHFPFIFL